MGQQHRTARSRASVANLLALTVALPSYHLEPPEKPGRFQV